MNLLEAIEARHSVRAYTDQKIEGEVKEQLTALVDSINEESGLHFIIRYNEAEGFDSRLAQYGHFKNVKNYVILAGRKEEDIEERCGYYGEKLVLEAQKLGLNTCWVAMTFNKSLVKKLVPAEMKLCMVIAIGYGETQGVQHKSKKLEKVVASKGEMPDWFRKGAEAALLAPTAVNQQKFRMGMQDGQPVIKVAGVGFHTKVDLGIVEYHFEIASGKKVFTYK